MAASILMCGEGGSNLELYRASLRDEGHQVEVLPPVQDALAHLDGAPVDLVIADLEDGSEASCGLVRSLQEAGAPEVLAILTRAPEDAEADALREAGVQEVLVRPFSMTRLALSVGNALDRVSMRRRISGDEPGGSEAPAAGPAAGAGAEPVAASPVTSGGDGSRVRDLEAELERTRRRAKEAELGRARSEALETKVESLKGLVRRKENELARIREELQTALDGEAASRERLAAREAALCGELDSSRLRYEQLSEAQHRARAALESEVERLLQELEQRALRHKEQLDLLSSEEASSSQALEDRIRHLTNDLASARARVEGLSAEKDDVARDLVAAKDEAERSRSRQAEFQAEVEEARKAQAELQKRIENEVRKRFNEVRVLVHERKKLLEENHRIKEEQGALVEEERTRRKQMELEIHELKRTLPTEQRKVHALVEYQRSLIENVLAGILTVDTSGVITLGNELGARHLQANLSDLLGTHVDQNTAFAPLRPLFAEALAADRAGPAELDVAPGITVRAVATKVPFGPRELVLISLVAPERVEVQAAGGPDLDEGPLALLGAAVAGNITDVEDFAVELRGFLERLYGKTAPDSPAREEANGALRKVGEMIDFLRDIIEQAESYLS